MLTNLLDALEWLARYGFIDILFGIGIIGYMKKLFKKSVVDQIPGVEIRRRFRPDGGYFEIEVLNLSSFPLYVYRAYFDPRFEYYPVPLKWFLVSYRTKFPKIRDTEMVGLSGDYLLEPHDRSGNSREWALLEHRSSAYYTIHIHDGENVINNERDRLETLIQNRECGTLTLFCVHGTQQNNLKVRV